MKKLLLKTILLLFALVAGGTTSWAQTTTTYTFTSKSWAATSGGSAANWTSGKDGAGFSNNGIQVTTAATGANGTSPISFTNVTKIVATYNTNKSDGKGTIEAKIGDNNKVTKDWKYASGSGDGRSAKYTVQWDYATPQTGKVKITCNTTTNSIYLVSVAITYSTDSPGYKVTYDANGATSGDVPTDATSYTSGATVTVLDNTGDLAKSGYTFGGWNTKADGTGTDRVAGSTFEITANTTLYAKWNAKTISTLTKTGTPTKTTYAAGESFDPTGLTVTATYTDESEEDVTSLVTWTPNPLTKGTTSVEGTYMGKTVTVDGLTVTVAPGSEERPYTVAEAIDAIKNSGNTKGVYVSGIVCTEGSNYYNSSKLNYWISDDGTTKNRFEIYRGLGVDGAAFTGTSDIQVGDIVTVKGDITLYQSSIYEFSEGSMITYFKRKNESDLAVSSSTSVDLELTTANPNPTSTITWTTSSTGDVTCTTSDEGVATVTNAGVITAVAAGTATITVSQVADDDYKEGSKTVTVTVSENREAVATAIDLSSAKTIVKGDVDDLAATSTKAVGFTGSVTYTYESSDPSIFSISEGKYTGAGVGATTVTITAIPSGGNAASYKPASQEVVVTVNGTNSISLDPATKTVAFSVSTFDIAATVPTENYSGTVSAESNNTSVATVSVDGTTVTVTPVAVGTATITVTAGSDTYYPAAAEAECTVTFTQPAGSDKAPASEVCVFEETFTGCDGTGGNTGGMSGNVASTDYSNSKADNSHAWTMSTAYAADKCVRMGTGKKLGSATTPSLALESGVTYTLSFRAAAWDGKNTNLKVSMTNGTLSASSVTMKNAEFDTFELTITNASADAKITFEGNSSNDSQFFLDDVKVFYTQDPSANVTLNKYGYATYCSVNPIDFTNTTGYTAWRVSEITSEGAITFKKIKDMIKGGQGVVLYNKDADGMNTSDVTVTFADGTTEFTPSENKLVGTLAPTNVEAGSAYGLSGNKFVVNNAPGNISAGKAYIEASSIPTGVKDFTLVFEDETTGITETRTATREEMEAIFNLAGQRMSRMHKGVNIVNGKKILVK